jgi:hypothetical protein
MLMFINECCYEHLQAFLNGFKPLTTQNTTADNFTAVYHTHTPGASPLARKPSAAPMTMTWKARVAMML